MSATALPELVGLQYTAQQLASLLSDAPGQAALPIRQGLAAAGKAAGLTDIAEARLAVVIDQLEELFTIDHLGFTTAFLIPAIALPIIGLVFAYLLRRKHRTAF